MTAREILDAITAREKAACLVAALEAVLVVHEERPCPDPATHASGAACQGFCYGCGEDLPCPTRRAITDALAGGGS